MPHHIYHDQGHTAHNCHCHQCQGHHNHPLPAADPMTPLTIGTAPVHVITDGVIVSTETDKYGREICTYTVHPDYVTGSDADATAGSFALMSPAQLSAIAAMLIDPDASNQISIGPNGLLDVAP